MGIWAKCKTGLKGRLPQYMLNLLMLFIFWGGLLRKSYNYDTVYHMVVGDADVVTRIRGGRYAAALIDYLLLKLGLRTTSNISVTIFLTLIVFAAAMLMMQILFERYMPDDILAKAGFYCGLNLVFLNVLFAELLMFSEYSIYFAFSYLAATAGVFYFVRRRYLPMLIMYVTAVSFYQNAIVYAAILAAFYIYLDEKTLLSLKAVVREAAAVAVCMLIGVLDLLSIRVLERLDMIPLSAKVSGMGNISEKLSAVASSFVSLNKNAAGIFPNLWLPLIFVAIIWMTIIYSRIKEQDFSGIIFLFIVCLGSYALLYIIPFASIDFYFPPRLSFCFFMVNGLLLVSSYAVSIKSLHRLLGMVGILYILLHFFFAGLIVSDHFVSNSLDEVYVNMLYDEILRYENETGIEVTKIAVMKDAYSPSSYPQVNFVSGQINERVIDAVPLSIIQVVTGRVLERVDMPKDIIEQYFKDKDWDYFSPKEQIVIEGDTAYWCIF
ncbi:MAG: hypothetical protein J1D87_01515 [Lachnospiraceae bacterium]|nr:hypothetical protein [Lachnospiraceae bacterium]